MHRWGFGSNRISCWFRGGQYYQQERVLLSLPILKEHPLKQFRVQVSPLSIPIRAIVWDEYYVTMLVSSEFPTHDGMEHFTARVVASRNKVLPTPGKPQKLVFVKLTLVRFKTAIPFRVDDVAAFPQQYSTRWQCYNRCPCSSQCWSICCCDR